jgi:hypothetical protein
MPRDYRRPHGRRRDRARRPPAPAPGPLFEAVNVEQLAGQTRFALSELSARNAAHEFKDLCRHVARARLVSNVPARERPGGRRGRAGPGLRDVPQLSARRAGSRWRLLARVADRPVPSASTLQQDGLPAKIRDDVAKIVGSGTAVAMCTYPPQGGLESPSATSFNARSAKSMTSRSRFGHLRAHRYPHRHARHRLTPRRRHDCAHDLPAPTQRPRQELKALKAAARATGDVSWATAGRPGPGGSAPRARPRRRRSSPAGRARARRRR